MLKAAFGHCLIVFASCLSQWESMTSSLVKWLRISVKHSSFLSPSDAFYAVQFKERDQSPLLGTDTFRHTARDRQILKTALGRHRFRFIQQTDGNDGRHGESGGKESNLGSLLGKWHQEVLWFLSLVWHQSMHYWWLWVYYQCVQTDEIPPRAPPPPPPRHYSPPETPYWD